MRLEAMRLGKSYAAIEARPAGRRHLLDRGFTAADIGVAQAVYMARHFARTDDFPALEAWYDRVTDRDGFRASLPPDGADRLYDRDFYPAWEDRDG